MAAINSAARKRRAFAFWLVLLAWSSVLLQCYLSLQLATHNGRSVASGIGIFFSYFTVITNLLICLSLTVSLMGPRSTLGNWCSRPDVVAGIGTSIAFVGISYHFLLRNTWNPQGAQLLADVLLHYVVPALYVLYWWFGTSKAALRWIHPLFWSIYPAVYLVYALIRGSIVGSYPYPFIDVARVGYERTTFNSLGLLSVFISLGLLLVALDRMRRCMRA